MAVLFWQDALVNPPFESVQVELRQFPSGGTWQSGNWHRLEMPVVLQFHLSGHGPVGKVDDHDKLVRIIGPHESDNVVFVRIMQPRNPVVFEG